MKGETAQQILEVAQDLVRQRGYSAFSYADISEQIGIRKASIHYHFSSKEDLAKELVRRYRDSLWQTLNQIEQTTSDPREQLLQFFCLYRDGLRHNQLCLCGMLSSDLAVLPKAVQDEVQSFFGETETWLAAVLQRGYAADRLKLRLPPPSEAAYLLATLQGAQLVARASEDREASFDRIIEPLLKAICSDC